MNEYRNKTVAVTGGAGFIGSRLAERLAFEERARVNVLVHTWPKAAWVSRADVRLFRGDVTEPASLEPAIQGAEIVFHCVVAGTTALCRQVNVEGTCNVLDVCSRLGVKRVVYFSTVGVHGPTLHEGLDETAPVVKVGFHYADSKIEAEELFWEYTKVRRLEGNVIRPTYVWGPNSPLFTTSPVKKMLQGRFALVDGGDRACNAVHVDNVVDLALLAGVHPRAVGEAFLVRDGDRLRWKEFFAYYAKMAGIDVETLTSVPSGRSVKRALSRGIRWPLVRGQKLLTSLIKGYDDPTRPFIRYGLRAPRKVLQLTAKAVEELLPDPYRPWDLRKYSSPGHISIEKAKTLLGYVPRVNVPEGMKGVELWLRMQNYVSDGTEGTDADLRCCQDLSVPKKPYHNPESYRWHGLS